MKKPFKIRKEAIFNRRTLLDIIAIALGSLFWVVAVNAIIVANNLLSGGLTGIALIINYLVPSIPVAVSLYLLNVPVLIWAFKDINTHLIAYTIFAVTWQSILLEVLKNIPTYTGDVFMACLFGGLLGGMGGGIIIRRRGSSGGMDILGIVIKKRYGYSVGTVGTALNVVIIGLSALLYNLEIAMYTFIFIAVCNFATDKTIEGLSKRYAAMIITEKPDILKEEIFLKIHRGVTFIDGSGAFSGVRRQIIYCVVNQYELATLREILHESDPGAFMTLSETKEIYGSFMKKGSHSREDLKRLENQAIAEVLAPRTPRDLRDYRQIYSNNKPPHNQSLK